MLYSKFGPTGAVTKIVPGATEQSGCIVTLAVGAAGATGTGFTVNDVPAETHVGFLLSRTVTK